MSDRSFLGDSVGRVVIKLVIVSLLVGIVMNLIGWTPVDVVWRVIAFFESIWNMGFSAISKIGYVLMIGAAIVVPIFLLLRVLNWRR